MTSCGAAEMTKNENRAAVEPSLEELHERRNVAAQTDAAAGLFEVLAANAAKLRIVPNQVGELASLLDQVRRGQPLDLPLEVRRTDQFAQHLARSR